MNNQNFVRSDLTPVTNDYIHFCTFPQIMYLYNFPFFFVGMKLQAINLASRMTTTDIGMKSLIGQLEVYLY